MAKLPAFQFYPADWLNDIKLQTCSLEAQGLLINLMCIMHQSDKYGYLLINGSIPTAKDVSHLLRLHHKTYDKTLKELFLKGVLSTNGNGEIFCKRMVKDEHIRQVRREAGKLGGSPLLNQKVKQEVNQKQTPSSSSSSSPLTTLKSSGQQPSVDLCPHQEIIDLYHEILPELQGVKIWSEKRKKLLKARWREDPKRQNLDYWKRLFGYIRKSPFLMGENDRHWTADLEWIINASNFVKIIEGKYHKSE
jgi:hypothetical protein